MNPLAKDRVARTKWRALAALFCFVLLQGNSGEAASTFEKLFCGADESPTSSDLGKCKIPDSPAAVQQALVAAAIANAQPCLRVSPTATSTATVDGCTVIPASEVEKLNLAPGMFVPQGRSLQKGSTDLKDPRVLFGMPPAFQITKSDGTVATFKNPLSKELFVGYSPRARTLEVLSYNREKGISDFYKVENYPGPSLKVNSHTGEDTCLKCHQAGGPIFPRAPWSETSSSLSVTKALCEKNGGKPYYQGIRFADKCSPTPSPVDPRASQEGRLAATAFDIDVRLSSRVLQARNACRTMCGDDLACRKLLIRSALKFPRAMSSLARIDTDNPTEAAEVLRFSLRPPRQKGSGVPVADPDDVDLEAKLRAKLLPGWKPEKYSYSSSTLPDRDPMTDPLKVTVARDAAGGTDKTYRENDTGTDKDLTGLQSAADPVLADPATKRPLAGSIPAEVAPLYAMDAAFDCFGFQSKDSWAIQDCAAKDPGAIAKILNSSYLDAAVNDWPLAPEQRPTAVRDSTMAAVAAVCGLGGAPAPCPYVAGVISQAQQDQAAKLAQAAASADATPASDNKFAQYCMECHSKSSVPIRDPAQMKKYNTDHGNEVCKRLKLLAGQDGRMPDGKSDQDFPPSERTAMLKYLGCGK